MDMDMDMDMDSTSSTNNNSHSVDDDHNGLLLGKKVYFEDVVVGPTKTKTKTKTKTRSNSNSNNNNNSNNGQQQQQQQTARCQVEGCKLDLSDIKAYYSRHKVCIMHSKSPKVIVAGNEQRFCQQCSRFHKLSEFDQGKRSCRRRLAGHNERRRKPQPASLLSARYGQFSSTIFDDNTRGGRFIMDFSAYPGVTARNPWSTVRSPEQVAENHPTVPGTPVGQWQSNSLNPSPDIFLQGSITTGTGYSSPRIIPQGECFTGVGADSTCALSLLSNQPWSSRNRPSSLGLMDVGVTVAQQTSHSDVTFNQYDTSWGLHEMSPPDLGLGQVSQQHSVDGGQLHDGIEVSQRRHYVELEQSRGYGDSAAQHVHWSL
ncbi:hypothetical protein ACFE04_003239 [Oxalis oulophora]